MPGVLCSGKDTDQPYVIESRAYCRGLKYRQGGTAAARPKANNPFPAWDVRSKDAWDRGWDKADSKADGTLTREDVGCCAGAGLAVPGAT